MSIVFWTRGISTLYVTLDGNVYPILRKCLGNKCRLLVEIDWADTTTLWICRTGLARALLVLVNHVTNSLNRIFRVFKKLWVGTNLTVRPSVSRPLPYVSDLFCIPRAFAPLCGAVISLLNHLNNSGSVSAVSCRNFGHVLLIMYLSS